MFNLKEQIQNLSKENDWTPLKDSYEKRECAYKLGLDISDYRNSELECLTREEILYMFMIPMEFD